MHCCSVGVSGANTAVSEPDLMSCTTSGWPVSAEASLTTAPAAPAEAPCWDLRLAAFVRPVKGLSAARVSLTVNAPASPPV